MRLERCKTENYEMINVVVPVYKAEEYLRRCVDSILVQTYRDFELILVDDGSPDRCGQICDEYATRDDRIKVIHQENGGVAAARNAGLDVARGEYFAFVDSDDYCHPEMLEVLYDRIVQYSADVAVSGFKRVDPNGNEIDFKPYLPEIEEVINGTDALKRLIMEDSLRSVVWNKLYKRNIFKSLRFPVGKLYEDGFITPRLLYQCDRIVLVPQYLYFYVANPTSLTKRPRTVQHFDLVESRFLRMKFLQEVGFPKEYVERAAQTAVCLYWQCLRDIGVNNISKGEKRRFNDVKKTVRVCYRNQGVKVKCAERFAFEFPILFHKLRNVKRAAQSLLRR